MGFYFRSHQETHKSRRPQWPQRPRYPISYIHTLPYALLQAVRLIGQRKGKSRGKVGIKDAEAQGPQHTQKSSLYSLFEPIKSHQL